MTAGRSDTCSTPRPARCTGGDTSGYWTGIVTGMRPDIAVRAAAGIGNVDGEPTQGTLAEFIAEEVSLLQPRHLVLCHHDDWMPPVTAPPDLDAIRAELARRAPGVTLRAPGYGEALPLHRILPAAAGQTETRSHTKISVSPGAMSRPAPRSP